MAAPVRLFMNVVHNMLNSAVVVVIAIDSNIFQQGQFSFSQLNTLIFDKKFGRLLFCSYSIRFTVFFHSTGNLGGTLGLALGASLLTLAEFLEFMILSILRCWQRNKVDSKIDKAVVTAWQPDRKK